MTYTMATKIPSTNQHEILHQMYPGDCCLCKSQERIRLLENEVRALKERLDYINDRGKEKDLLI